jgi:hypothetical protein
VGASVQPVAGAVPKTASTPKSSAKSAAVKAPTTKAVKSKPAASKSKASGAAAKTKAAAAPKGTRCGCHAACYCELGAVIG